MKRPVVADKIREILCSVAPHELTSSEIFDELSDDIEYSFASRNQVHNLLTSLTYQQHLYRRKISDPNNPRIKYRYRITELGKSTIK